MKPLVFLTMLLSMGCSSSKKAGEAVNNTVSEVVPVFEPGPHVIVYRTTADLRLHVPVLLADNGKDINSYPHPSDLSIGGRLKLPTVLKKGYLLDNRGINPNAAFLKLTYADYAKLEQAPSINELNTLIIDREPFTEMCDCGLRSAFTDIETQLNQWIEKDRLRSVCKVLK